MTTVWNSSHSSSVTCDSAITGPLDRCSCRVRRPDGWRSEALRRRRRGGCRRVRAAGAGRRPGRARRGAAARPARSGCGSSTPRAVSSPGSVASRSGDGPAKAWRSSRAPASRMSVSTSPRRRASRVSPTPIAFGASAGPSRSSTASMRRVRQRCTAAATSSSSRSSEAPSARLPCSSTSSRSASWPLTDSRSREMPRGSPARRTRSGCRLAHDRSRSLATVSALRSHESSARPGSAGGTSRRPAPCAARRGRPR